MSDKKKPRPASSGAGREDNVGLHEQQAELDKRRSFFLAAEPLLMRYGYRKTTVEEICRAAGASKRTFYELFDHKFDLFLQYAMDYSDRLIEGWRAHAAKLDSAIERFDSYLSVYLSHFYRNPVFREVFLDPANINLISELDYEQAFPSIITGFSEMIEQGMAQGEFREMNPKAITWIIHALMDGLFLVDSDLHGSDPIIQTEQFTHDVRAFILHGLGADPARIAASSWPPDDPGPGPEEIRPASPDGGTP